MSHLSYIDIILVIPLVWGLYKGFRKGLIIEIASLIALLLGIYCSIHFSDYVSDYLKSSFSIKSSYLPVISFATTFLIIVIIVYTIAHIVDRIVDSVSLTFINKLAGAIFGMIKIGFILSVILYLVNTLDVKKTFISDSKRSVSILYNPISNLALILLPSIKDIKIKKPFDLIETGRPQNSKQ